MDDIGCRWTVWAGHGNTAGPKTVSMGIENGRVLGTESVRAGHSGSPQAARPAVSERETGPGRVPGCSAMPGAWRSQPAPGKARGITGQDTVERHGGLDVVMEKIAQWEQETPATNGRRMIDDFRLWGSRPCRHMGGHLTNGGLPTICQEVETCFVWPSVTGIHSCRKPENRSRSRGFGVDHRRRATPARGRLRQQQP